MVQFTAPAQVASITPQYQSVKGSIIIDVNQAFTMQGISNVIQVSYPRDPCASVVGIGVPLLGIKLRKIGIIDPADEVKSAVSQMYSYLTTGILKPIWNSLYKLYEKLKRFGLGIINLSLGVLNLRIPDLFKTNLWDVIKQRVAALWQRGKGELNRILKILDIPQFAVNFQSPQKEIEEVSKRIYSSLWTEFYKKIMKVIEFIQNGLKIWDSINRTTFSILWNQIYKATFGKIINLFTKGISINGITEAILAFARKVYGKFDVTFNEIMLAMKNFKLPVFGNPFDWVLPWNPRINFPNLDFAKLVSDIKIWITNYLASILKKFVKMVSRIIQFFVGPIRFPIITIPIVLYVERNASC